MYQLYILYIYSNYYLRYTMDIIIRNQSTDPIYLQIENQIKAMIISGQLAEGQALPSMRLLAKELRISMITTKRAYEELEKDGFIYTVAGKGCFVAAKNSRLVRENRLKEIENHFLTACDIAKINGISFGELSEMLGIIFEGE